MAASEHRRGLRADRQAAVAFAASPPVVVARPAGVVVMTHLDAVVVVARPNAVEVARLAAAVVVERPNAVVARLAAVVVVAPSRWGIDRLPMASVVAVEQCCWRPTMAVSWTLVGACVTGTDQQSGAELQTPQKVVVALVVE